MVLACKCKIHSQYQHLVSLRSWYHDIVVCSGIVLTRILSPSFPDSVSLFSPLFLSSPTVSLLSSPFVSPTVIPPCSLPACSASPFLSPSFHLLSPYLCLTGLFCNCHQFCLTPCPPLGKLSGISETGRSQVGCTFLMSNQQYHTSKGDLSNITTNDYCQQWRKSQRQQNI